MFKFLKDLLGKLFFNRELDELNRWRVETNSYAQWLAEFPEIRIALLNLAADVRGEESLCANRPPSEKGPWDIVGLRLKLRTLKSSLEVSAFERDFVIEELVAHYCGIVDNLGDIPIPNFEEWAKKQYVRATNTLDKGNYFREALYRKQTNVKTDRQR